MFHLFCRENVRDLDFLVLACASVRPRLRAIPSLSLWRHAVMVSSFLAAYGAALEITGSVVRCPMPTKECGVLVELMGSFFWGRVHRHTARGSVNRDMAPRG